jgi:hypothetical protein
MDSKQMTFTTDERTPNMNGSNNLVVTWTRVGIVTGFLACTVYPLLIAVPMPTQLTVLLAAAFGPLLGVASIGLYRFISVHRKTVSLQIATISTIIAGTVVNMMLVVQMTGREYMRLGLDNAANLETEQLLRMAYSAADKVQLGLDVSWDVYISLGTILFAINMFRHPRFGRVIGASGIVIGVLLLCINLFTFPVPPADAGSVDLGPLVGMWYLVVTIILARSVKWLKIQQQQET